MQKKAGLTLALLACTLPLAGKRMFAQAAQSTSADQSAEAKAAELNIQLLREDIRSDRKQITAANLPLTPDEATKFWPVYDQYIQETIAINDIRWGVMKDYSANYDKVTDQMAEDYMKKSAEADRKLIELRESYVPKFEKVIPSKKAALWYQIDRRLDLLINLQLTTLVPAVDTHK
jgi:hypothetical protein